MRQPYYKRVSIIIPVYNREKTIERCIQSLINLDYPKKRMEMIFVDSSTDNTSKILSKYNGDGIKVLYQKRQGISPARNWGIENSNGEIIVFIDSDCFATKDWLRNLVKAFVDEKIGGVGGRLPNNSPENCLEKYMTTLIDNHQSHLEDLRPFLVTANAAYSRKALEATGLFDPGLVAGEDADISWRVGKTGYKILYEQNAIAYHKNRSTIASLIAQQFRDGKGWAQLSLKYRISIRIYKTISYESIRLFSFTVKFLLRFIFSIFAKVKSPYILAPLYDFIRKISYLSGYVYGYIFTKSIRK